MSVPARKWIVGLDLRPASQGAIRFARWLADTSGHDSFIGVHVLEEAHLQPALRYHHLDELVTAARTVAERIVADCDAAETLQQIEIVQGVHAERSLEAAREYHYCDAIVVGRQAPREGHRLLRLGRVARRLLRSLDCPVVVVPPDYESDGSEGPVVVSTNLREDAEDCLQFAAEMAERLSRKLVVVHVVPYADDYGANYIPEASRRKIAAQNQKDGEEGLHRWLVGNAITGAEEVVVQGGVVERVIEAATQRQASLVVSGSRLLSSLERLLLTSIGSELAATAPCPVAVVPPRTRS